MFIHITTNDKYYNNIAFESQLKCWYDYYKRLC